MHIPDGFLATPVWAALDAAAVPAVGYVARRAQKGFEENQAPLLGVMGAFVFAAQMINFPVGAGTSGHLVGSALLAYTLGPAAAAVVMTAILAIQALVFQDGGVLALGANLINMALFGTVVAYLPFYFWSTGRLRSAAVFTGAFLSVLAGALLAIAELMISGIRIPAAMLGVSLALFVVSAVFEGAITLAVVRALDAMNAGMVRRPAAGWRAGAALVALAAVLLAAVGAMFASAHPDGLEKLAGNVGISGQARALISTPLAEYEWASLSSPWLRKASAGLAGLALIYGACLVFGRAVRKRRSV